MSLVTLANMKTYLGLSGTTYDSFLQGQLDLISEAVEGYCGRKFEENEYVQTFYRDDFASAQKELLLFHYPVKTIASIVDEDANPIENVRLHKESGKIKDTEAYFLPHAKAELVVTYTAGYTTIPAILSSVVTTLVEQRYNKKISGVALDFGSDVQRISIPGTLSIDFDYSLSSNERKSKYGTILGSQMNLLDPFRSERGVGQYGEIAYVEETP